MNTLEDKYHDIIVMMNDSKSNSIDESELYNAIIYFWLVSNYSELRFETKAAKLRTHNALVHESLLDFEFESKDKYNLLCDKWRSHGDLIHGRTIKESMSDDGHLRSLRKLDGRGLNFKQMSMYRDQTNKLMLHYGKNKYK